MKVTDIDKILKSATTTTKWELDNITYWDRTTNPQTLLNFLNRILHLRHIEFKSSNETVELEYLLSMLDDLDVRECCDILDSSNDEDVKMRFIENLARTCAIETLTMGKLSFESMNTACKLSPTDFILCAKRTQDLINAIHGLVIKGETLSKDVAGA